MVKLHLSTGIAACLAAAVVISCGDTNAPLQSEPAAKIAHAGHDAQNVVVEDLSNDRAIMAAATHGSGRNALWGYIDKAGEWVLPPRANSVGSWQRNEQGRWVFVRRHAAFTRAYPFSDGLARVRDQETELWGFIDNQGQWVIEPRFEHIEGFGMGLAALRDAATGLNGFIDRSGAWAIEPQWRHGVGPFAEHVAPAYSDSEEHGGCGYINQSGGWAIEPQYRACHTFYNGLAVVYGENNLYGYINVDNDLVIETQFERAMPFSDGLARVMLDDEHRAVIDRYGQFVIGPEHGRAGDLSAFANGLAAKKSGGLWGYIDKSGGWAIEPRFDWAGAFSEGLAVVRSAEGNKKVGFIDVAGEWVIEPQFGSAGSFTRTTP